MEERNEAVKPNYKLSSNQLLALKHAIQNSMKTGSAASENPIDLITGYFSSFIHVNITIAQNEIKTKEHNNLDNYILVISDVPLLPKISGDEFCYKNTSNYFLLDALRVLITDKHMDDLEDELTKAYNILNEEHKYYPGAIETKREQLFQEAKLIFNETQKDRKTFLWHCTEESMRNRMEAINKRDYFMETILDTSKGSSEEYDMEKWLDGFLHIELEVVRDEDGFEKFMIRKIKLKTINVKPTTDEYCFETKDDLEEFSFEAFSKGNFYESHEAAGYSTCKRIRGKRFSSSFCMDTLMEYLKGMFNICKSSSWLSPDLAYSQQVCEFRKKKAAGSMFAEIWRIKEHICSILCKNQYNLIEFFTSEKEDSISLHSIDTKQLKDKPVVTVFTIPEVELHSYKLQCFILDPSLSEDTSSFIDGLIVESRY